MTRRSDLKLSHGATAKARENAVKQDRVPTTNAIGITLKARISAPDGIYRRDNSRAAARRLSNSDSGCSCRRHSVVWNSHRRASVTRVEASRISSDTRFPLSS